MSVLLEEVLHDESAVVDRLGDDRLRELAVDHLGEQPLRRTLVHAQAHARRALAEVGDERGHQPAARGADDAEARVPGLETLQQREVGAHRFELALHPARPLEHEQRRTRWARRPRRLRTSSGTPSSASSWRTWSDTFDCTVANASAAAVNDPSSAMASSVSRCRSSMAALS